jgi:hypothetical protein
MVSQLKAVATMRHGFFPLSSNGLPNGSLHFGKACKDALDYDAGFRCIADGEVIAYRLDKQLHVLDFGPEPNRRVIEYSLGFVLVRHWLPLPPVPSADSAQPTTKNPLTAAKEKPADATDEGIYLYSLYSYNRPLNQYRTESRSIRKDALPFWQGDRVFHVSARCTDIQEPPPLVETPQWLIDQHEWKCLPPPPPPPLPPFYDSPPIVGRRIRAAGKGDAAILGILHQGAEFTVEGDRTTGWARLRTLRSGDPFPAVKNEVVPDEAMRGWVHLGGMDSAIDPALDTLDRVVVLDTPYPVKAGERLGFLGENPASQHAAPRRGTMRRDPAMALEVFAGEDFPGYLAQARERAAALPDAEKTVLTIEARSKGVYEPLGAADLLLSTQVLIPEPDNAPGLFVRGKRYNVVPSPPEAEPSTSAPEKKKTGFRCSADGWERIEAVKFAALPATEQAKYPCEEVLEPVDGRLFWGLRNAPVNQEHDLWNDYPLNMDRAILAPIPSAMAIPRSELDALPAERKATDPKGVRWWKIHISGKNHIAKVWVAEKDLPGVSWQSPQAWPAFRLIDGTTFSFLEAFQRHAVITGKVHPEHEQSFTATANALAHSEFIVELERAIDDTTDKDGRIDGKDLAMARTKPLLAHALSRMIVRFESQWSTNQDRWAAMDDIMEHDWKGERERQTKRGWWDEVASRIDSFPQDPRVYHIHPYGWIDNFSIGIDVIAELAEIIALGEAGSYEAYNTGTKNVPGGRVGHSFAVSGPVSVTEKTINQILATESLDGTDKRRLFATGRYQTIFRTLKDARDRMRLTGDEPYDAAMQERVLREHLIPTAGDGALHRFVVKGLGTVDEAQLAAAKQWASIGVPAAMTNKYGHTSDGTTSYYEKKGVNSAHPKATARLRSFLAELSRRRSGN